jgi:uncharacterized Tic20 family protein
MSDYHDIWGSAQKDWKAIDFRAKHALNVLTVVAWIAMVAFFFSVLFVILVPASHIAPALMILFLLTWIAAGVAVIRIRRTTKKMVICVND